MSQATSVTYEGGVALCAAVFGHFQITFKSVAVELALHAPPEWCLGIIAVFHKDNVRSRRLAEAPGFRGYQMKL